MDTKDEKACDDTREVVLQSVPCIKGCGFYGTTATLSMCSSCFRAHSKESVKAEVAKIEQQQEIVTPKLLPAPTPSLAIPSIPELSSKPASPKSAALPLLALPAPAPATVAAAPIPAPLPAVEEPAVKAVVEDAKGPSEEDGSGNGRPVQKNKGRCFKCKKKIGFTGCECRCGYVFCGDHRYADAHSCDFDYKHLKKEILTEANPVIMAKKVDML
jgi:hypothetical protein